MKGVVFTEFMSMVKNQFGADMVDTLITKTNLSHKGAYVADGTYPHQEMVSLVTVLGKETNTETGDLLIAFGKYLFTHLVKLQPQFAENSKNPLEFIASVDEIIHVEVRKLYPDAELPRFLTVEKSDNKLVMDYVSKRKMELFGYGLMQGCADHYNQPIKIEHHTLEGKEEHTVRFSITMA